MAHSERERVRVRFAPSPTGFLHVGGARTAIFNWLYARKSGGAFVLRIEDTDIERSTRESESSLLEDLRWLGLDWDEGPDVGGSFFPYRQSERLRLYRDRTDRLVENGRAYPCFCTDEVLDAKRREAARRGRPPHYDGACRKLTDEDIRRKRAEGLPEAIRFRVRDGAVLFEDLIRGPIELKTQMVGDFVVIRSNGRPTYNFAAAVDDSQMRVSHVLRGEEHLSNTLRQILVLGALEEAVPRYGHLPIILAEDRSKLSKRHGASSVGDLRVEGFLPEAAVNYLVLLGWSHPEGREVFSIDEILEEFTLERVGKSAAVYDKEKLRWMNGQHLRRKPVDELFESADAFFPEGLKSLYERDARREILRLLQDGIHCLSDLGKAGNIFGFPPKMEADAVEVLKSREAIEVLDALEALLRSAGDDFTADEFRALMKQLEKRTGKRGKTLYFPIRAAATGAVHGPDLAGVAAVKGRETLLRLIDRARADFGAASA